MFTVVAPAMTALPSSNVLTSLGAPRMLSIATSKQRLLRPQNPVVRRRSSRQRFLHVGVRLPSTIASTVPLQTTSTSRKLPPKTKRGRWHMLLTSLVGSAVLAAAATLAAVKSFQETRVPPKLSGFSSTVLDRCPSLQDYDPVFGLTNRHVETIFSSRFRADPGVEYRREFLTRCCGGVLAIDWPLDRSIPGAQAAADDAPVVMVISGLSGGSHDPYVQHQMLAARKRGYKACVMNCRGCGGSPITSPYLFSAGYTEDIRVTIQHLRELHPNSPLVGCGWSLGANMLLRYVGEEGDKCPLVAAVSSCNPFNLPISMGGLKRGFSQIYDYNLARTIAGDLISPYVNVFEGRNRGACIPSALESKSLTEFDEYVTRRHFGYKSVDEYYDKTGSHWSIPDIKIPVLVINAENDPISARAAIPFEKIEANPNFSLVLTKGGGHLGWTSEREGITGAPWPNEGIVEWISAVVDQQREIESINTVPLESIDMDDTLAEELGQDVELEEGQQGNTVDTNTEREQIPT